MSTFLPYLNEVSEKLGDFFSESSIEKIARETGFVRRSSKLMGFVFCQLLLKMFTKSLPCVSLTDYKAELKNSHNIAISEEGINQRFNEQSIDFFKELSNRLLALQLNSVISNAELDLPFKDIQLLDSTYIKLPDCMSELFPGTGKKGAKETGNSGYKWHLEYRFLSGDFIGMITCVGTENDAKQIDTHLEEGKIEQGVLYIRDLGYYKMETFEKIDKAGASFLSRMKKNTIIYEKTDKEDLEQVDLVDVVKKMRKAKIKRKSIWVYISEKHLYVRLIIEAIPDEARKKRVRNLKKSTKKGKQLKKHTLVLAGYNLYITNIKEEDLPMEKVRLIYSIRWQIELTFKIWKSLLKVDEYQKMKPERILTLLYAKLLWILMISKALLQIKNILFNLKDQANGIEISEYKLFKLFKLQFSDSFITAVFHPKKSKLLALLKKLYHLAKICCKKEVKKGKETPMIILKNINKKENVKKIKQRKYMSNAA